MHAWLPTNSMAFLRESFYGSLDWYINSSESPGHHHTRITNEAYRVLQQNCHHQGSALQLVAMLWARNQSFPTRSRVNSLEFQS